MTTPSIQTLITQAQQVLNLKSSNEIRATLAAILANANVGTPLNPNLTTQQLWDEFYEIVRQPSDDIMSIITDQMMRMVFSPPAPGGAGANGQVIFNDMGVLAGDADLTFNKALNKLVANNIETAAGLLVGTSATITGDLTVDTSTLKVDSTNNRVIVGHTSGSSAFQVTNAGAAGLEIQPTGVNSAPVILSYNRSGSAYTQLTLDGSSVVHNLSGSTAMTLNSTGLGVGGVVTGTGPTILVEGTAGTYAKFNSKVGAKTWSAGYRSGTTQFEIQEDLVERLVIANGGNVGVGVTPSAWNYGKVIEFGGGSIFTDSGNNECSIVQGAYNNAGWKYKYTGLAVGLASNYLGTHVWYTAPSGTAGNAITFTQAMTLDASGNLLVKKTAVSGSTLGCELLANGQVNGATAGLDNLNIYNTTAGAYRFYIDAAGTVHATNVVISAISDARYKENVQDIDVGLAAILSLKPRKFDWKAGKGKDIKGDRGFIAQEFEQVFPNLVDDWKDPAPEGEAPYKSVRQDLIPVLVKAIQELTARVQTLEAR